MGKRILVIDDDPGLLALMELGLGRNGFTVGKAADGREGLRLAYETHPDLIILDISMPNMDGWLTCQRLRYVSDTPIIMLTARSAPKDILKGLALGADDYVTKPCNFDELKARIHTVLRRARKQAGSAWQPEYDDGNLCIDLSEGTATRVGELVHLTPTETRLLMYLVSQKGRVVPQKELLVNVWGPECAEEIGYLSVYVRYLRRKIEDDPDSPRYIRTRRGVGYYFADDGRVGQKASTTGGGLA